MDRAWLEKNSFLDQERINLFFFSLGDCHFESGYAWEGAVSDAFSDLAPLARGHFWRELEQYANAHINFPIERARDSINEKLAEYAPLPADPEKASNGVFHELEVLWNRCYRNPKSDYDGPDELSINAFYFEVRWVLGQILATFPDILDVQEEWEWEGDEFPGKYADLSTAYYVVEFLVKTLGDQHIRDFYNDICSELFAVQMECVLENKC